VEQYFQSEKALFFKDEQRAAQILKQTEPRTQKRLGEQVRCSHADNGRWLLQAKKVMLEAVKCKMEQNPLARDALLKTGDHQLGEASKDRYWGTGVPIHHRNATNPSYWRGDNVLGQIMCEVREMIQS
jgi:ribA/ribD-fused uncharacterized protein